MSTSFEILQRGISISCENRYLKETNGFDSFDFFKVISISQDFCRIIIFR